MPSSERAIGIWGLGRDGAAAARFLRDQNPTASITLLSDNSEEAVPAALADFPLRVGDQAREAIVSGSFDLIVKSPGVPIIRPEIASAVANGTRFTSGTNLWFESAKPARSVAVTGTKGKSTTSLLIHSIAKATGAGSKLLGNGGVPALSEQAGADLTVLELSSYQCADLAHGPDIVVFTNLFPEHVPWHGSVEEYYAAKLRLAQLRPETQVIANARDAQLRSRLAGRDAVIWFNSHDGYHERDGKLYYRDDRVELKGSPPRGAHNIGNLAAAATVIRFLGLITDPLNIDLGRYGDLPHRLQIIELPDDISAVDDSISTIPEATIAALSLFPERRVHAILGGSDRGQDYAGLADVMAKRGVITAYLLPHTGDRIGEILAARAPRVGRHSCDDLPAAMSVINANIAPGDVILLSPAAPSHAQYSNFEERGRHFQSLLGGLSSKA